jgi:hypothetical protein
MTTRIRLSWVKRFDVLLAGKKRLEVTRRLLRKAQRDASCGRLDFDDRNTRRFLWLHLFEYVDLTTRLASGQRSGTISAELGIDIDAKPVDFGVLLENLMRYRSTITLPRAGA